MNIYQVCDLFDYVVNNVEYVSDPRVEYMAKPSETLTAGGGDCDDQAILLAALIDAIGGTPRIYLTEDHMFAAVYIGDENNINSIESAIGKYYNTPITLHYLTDDSGVWLLLDSTSSFFYAGGLPTGAKPTRAGWTFENATTISVIDVTPYFEGIQEGLNVSDIIFCSCIRGDRDYDEQPDATYDSGDTVWMYYETSNFDTKKQDGTYNVWLKYSLKVSDSDNNIMYEDLDWNEIHENYTTVPGYEYYWSADNLKTSNYQKDQYKVEITVEDIISGESKAATGYFKIATEPEGAGFEIVFAIAGLLVVAYLLRRRK